MADRNGGDELRQRCVTRIVYVTIVCSSLLGCRSFSGDSVPGDRVGPIVRVNNYSEETITIRYRAENDTPTPGTDSPGLLRAQEFVLKPAETNHFRPFPTEDYCTLEPIVALVADVEVLRLDDPICFEEGHTWTIRQDMLRR